MAKIGDRAKPSSRFSSRELVTKMRRTETKYHSKGGMTTRVNGRVTTVITSAPTTMKAITEKSNSVDGSKSSLLPTSALKRFIMRPSGLVSKNSILARRTAFAIRS